MEKFKLHQSGFLQKQVNLTECYIKLLYLLCLKFLFEILLKILRNYIRRIKNFFLIAKVIYISYISLYSATYNYKHILRLQNFQKLLFDILKKLPRSCIFFQRQNIFRLQCFDFLAPFPRMILLLLFLLFLFFSSFITLQSIFFLYSLLFFLPKCSQFLFYNVFFLLF